jgi:hypothetical protein
MGSYQPQPPLLLILLLHCTAVSAIDVAAMLLKPAWQLLFKPNHLLATPITLTQSHSPNAAAAVANVAAAAAAAAV